MHRFGRGIPSRKLSLHAPPVFGNGDVWGTCGEPSPRNLRQRGRRKGSFHQEKRTQGKTQSASDKRDALEPSPTKKRLNGGKKRRRPFSFPSGEKVSFSLAGGKKKKCSYGLVGQRIGGGERVLLWSKRPAAWTRRRISSIFKGGHLGKKGLPDPRGVRHY